ncbi:MAG: bifunctional (p)ppGpp synthetase/guanosine-3',5'-bis(diphosphate) 3'-pyrophosphohydrolase [Chloroflexi bacterium]|nr:bifunctional (p)ppGpp synthetase/guanosine-3',5'-bis(diphosphate) 3'-pyrophosphohydrolase [Chloroflexota bacterium]
MTATIEQIVARTRENFPQADVQVVRLAYEFACRAHGTQLRKSGEPFITHPCAVAELLSDLRLDPQTIAAALLHDVVEDNKAITIKDMTSAFGDEIAGLVNGVTKLSEINLNFEQNEAESFRKLFIAMSQDLRVILIKLADRLHNMRTMQFLKAESQVRNARETREIYAPLASRLGIYKFKSELEDLAFRYLEPEAYQDLATRLISLEEERVQFLQRVIDTLQERLAESDIKAVISGREKHLYSIHRKMVEKDRDFDQIYDLRAIRVIVDSEPECYSVVGIVHTIWRPIPREFDDYINNPKENGYQSLHTAVIGPRGKPFEVQIRTHEMHRFAEYGVAAHWRYKEAGQRRDDWMDNRIAWLRQMLESRQDSVDASEFVLSLKSDLLPDRVLVFTPKGDLIDLPTGSTPIDFAFAVHTVVGERCRGAKVNGRQVPLDYRLHNGDRVEVVTANSGGPSLDWLNESLGFVVSHRAKQKIRQWFRKQNRESAIMNGRDLLDKAMRKLGVHDEGYALLMSLGTYDSSDEMFAAIGYGDASPQTLVTRLLDKQKEEEIKLSKAPVKSAAGALVVKGLGGMLTTLARCCNPVPGDAIVGYVTRGRGVTVHRRDCRNLAPHATERERLIEVSWGQRSDDRTVPVPIRIIAIDRPGLMRDVADVVASEGVNIVDANTKTNEKDHTANLTWTLQITDMAQLSKILFKIERLPSVIEAYRQTSH